MRPTTILLAALAATASLTAAAAQASSQSEPPSPRLRMLAAEDARDASPQAIVPLLEGLKSADAEIRRVAVRGLGRLEREALGPHIVLGLKDPEASVRAEAANALAQSVFVEGDVAAIGEVARTLADALRAESHPLVRGALAAAIGRLRHPDDAAGQAAGMLVLDVAAPQDGTGVRRPASTAVLLGALRGLAALARAGAHAGGPARDAAGRPVTWLPDAALAPLVSLLLDGRPASPPPPARPAGGDAPPAADVAIRRLVLQALAGTRRNFPAVGLALIDDADDQARAVAARWAVDALRGEDARTTIAGEWARLRATPETEARAWLAARVAEYERRITVDPSPQVRFEAIRAIGEAGLGAAGCGWLLRGFEDSDVNVARQAMSTVVPSCRGDERVRARLEALASPAPAPHATSSWHRPAYALLGLASLDASAARPRVLAALGSPEAWTRRYAAIAAGLVLEAAGNRQAPDEAVASAVAALVEDADTNVATEAVRAVGRLTRAEARPHALRALRRNGEELLIEAVKLLSPGPAAGDGTPPAAADQIIAAACGDALARLTAMRRETSRDPRLALVGCVMRTGSAGDAPRLAPLLADFDPVVARAAASALARLAPPGDRQPVEARPVPLARAPLPGEGDLARMGTARIVVSIRGRGDIVMRLRPDEAPLNAFRFLRLAEAGYYTGLTIHRIAPRFVVQGGSPHGNEYSGDGPFTRDETGRLANLRGSIGLSTRGRDTGDAQFYVNLADNLRLDHNYTVFAQVEAGMDVVDSLVEGDAIERIAVR